MTRRYTGTRTASGFELEQESREPDVEMCIRCNEQPMDYEDTGLCQWCEPDDAPPCGEEDFDDGF